MQYILLNIISLYQKLNMWRLWWWRYGIMIAIMCLSFILTVPASTPHISDIWDEIAYTTADYHFDFITWELQAIGSKLDGFFFGQSAFQSEADRSSFVRTYSTDLAQILSLEAQIDTIFNTPTTHNSTVTIEHLRSQRESLRQNLQQRQSTFEAILEGQIASVLVDQGFGIYGQLIPPMAMRFTQMPNLLVTSPRDAIRMENSLPIDPLLIDQRVLLEDDVMAQYDVSAIIVPLGGIALYPAMIAESSNLSFVIETFAHEWLHHYLYFHPLGLSYFTGDAFAGEARIINETTADLFGKEIATLVIERYYPEIAPPPLPTAEQSELTTMPLDPNAFDFGAEMNQTRMTVDALLASGDVEQAETYMEERRIFFYDNGYALRRINQAFFAFYGGYQAGGGIEGAGGTDIIGPTVIRIRDSSDSIHHFIQTMQTITTREQLLQHCSINC